MKRLIGTSLSILVLSALSAGTVKASENRLEYQLHLTDHSVLTMPQGATQVTPKAPISMSIEKPQVKPEQSGSAVQPVRSGNPYAHSTRPLWDPVQNVILPIN
jgi:hypothetical protein